MNVDISTLSNEQKSTYVSRLKDLTSELVSFNMLIRIKYDLFNMI